MIDLAYVQEQIEMTKREKLLKTHPYSIWSGQNGYWYTYLPKDDGGRLLKKRKSESAIQDLLVDYYLEKQQTSKKKSEHSFEACYQQWRGRQEMYGRRPETLVKYDADYRRFFEDSKFAQMEIDKITEDDISFFIIDTIKRMHLKEKAGKSLWGYIRGVFRWAKLNRKIKEDPTEHVDIRMFDKFYNRTKAPMNRRVVADDALKLILQQVAKDHQDKPWLITSYAIELAANTGMRVGELSALRWSNVLLQERVIIICESEIRDRVNKKFHITKTKNGKERVYPMSDALVEFFENLRAVKREQGISDGCSYEDEQGNELVGDFVFTNAEGRIHAQAISDCIKIKCQQAGIEPVSIHALRRTLNSKMRCSGVSATVAASLLGHTERVNENNYTYDITEMSYKRDIVEQLSVCG